MLVQPTATAATVLANLPELVSSIYKRKTYYWLRVQTGDGSYQLLSVTAAKLPAGLGADFHACHVAVTKQ